MRCDYDCDFDSILEIDHLLLLFQHNIPQKKIP